MIFNDATGGQGICQEIDDLCDSNTTSYPLVKKARRVGQALETLVSKIIKVCRNYPFDDENYTDIASGVITLSEGISKYTITDKFLEILEVKVKDSDGQWHIVKPTTQREEEQIMETLEAQTGLPTKYRVFGRTFKFSPAPTASAVTLTDGLKFTYSRTANLPVGDNSSGDNNIIIGIASPWHVTIAKMASLPYCKSYKKDRVQQLMIDIDNEMRDCLDFYANRQKDRVNRLTVKQESNK